MALEQLGLATMPWCPSRSWGLISGTTNGTDESIRKAELLSIATQPRFTASCANFTEFSEPALKIAMSKSLNESGVVSWILCVCPSASNSFPADRDEASNLNSLAGNSLFSRSLIISWPTAPVAPTIPIRYFFNECNFKG